ncbi:hypothetical protein [Actinomadura rudentiformis]|uniref:DUF3592 domain-containing protein n=1 Tax=Actinomadura rudentiformis TaxID=359158 RepID=A0A6H9YRG6_9ACTN|nr:hypothetical protein [Actinomadura rudentiformis]KAB2350298.1 hypothetical protein F8566_11005 [Actinomadura rudentiformis]
MVDAQGRTAAWKGRPLVAAGWVGLPLVLFLLLGTEDTAGWWRWPVAALGYGCFVCVAVGMVRLSRRHGGQGTGTLMVALFAAFPVLVLLGTITPARAERVESCQVSALKPTRELWLQQEYQVACPSGKRQVVYRPSSRKKMSDRDRQLHAVGAKVWVSHSKDDPNGKATFVQGPGSRRLGTVLAILFIVGLLSAVGIWRGLVRPRGRVPE